MKRVILVGILAVSVVGGACGKKSGGSTGASMANFNPTAVQQFKTECSLCHGADGKGNGPSAVNLNPKPRNYTDKVWQDSVTDDHIKDVITRGGKDALGAGHETSAMPPHPGLPPEVLTGLVQIVRSFRQ